MQYWVGVYQISFWLWAFYFLLGQQEEGRQDGFVQTAADVLAFAGIDEGIQTNGGHAQLGQKVEGLGEGVDVIIQHGGVGHHI